ncbi:hypothetical protein Tco_1197242, partial [Tanacetum coccineum]
DIDPEIQAEIDECIAYADVLRARVLDDILEPTQEEGAIDITYETLGDLVQKFHDYTIVILVHRVQAMESIQRDQGHRIIATSQQSTVLLERINELERDNMRLRGTLDVASQRVSRLQTMSNTRSGATMTRKAVKELIERQVVKALEASDVVGNLEPLVESEGEQEDENGDDNEGG